MEAGSARPGQEPYPHLPLVGSAAGAPLAGKRQLGASAPTVSAPSVPSAPKPAAAAEAAHRDTSSHLPLSYGLSAEGTLYINKIVEAITGLAAGGSPEPAALRGALQSLASDPGIQQAVPVLISTISGKFKSTRSTRVLVAILQAFDALMHNPHANLEPFMHQ